MLNFDVMKILILESLRNLNGIQEDDVLDNVTEFPLQF